MTTFSVIINTFNRKEKLEPLLALMRKQTFTDFEVIVADDGSTDGTADLMATLVDDRVRYVRQENAGLGAARNLGARNAKGDYLVWLDDDDEVGDRWLESFAAVGIESAPAVVSIAARLVAPDGSLVEVRHPKDLGPAFDHHVGLVLCGSFTVRRDAFDAVGGFTPGLGCSHQTELFLRLLPWCTENDRTVLHNDVDAVTIHRSPAGERGRNDPARLLRCTKWFIDERGDRLARDPALYASHCAIAGWCSARLGRYRDARRWFRRGLRARPTDARMLGRLAAAAVPPVARRVWPAQRPGTAPFASP
jgi:glycosyltransferase involved in cell wall biosynthesis